jgi:cell division protein FtsB
VAVKARTPWGKTPKKPKVGAGRAALAKRTKVRSKNRKANTRRESANQEKKRAVAARRGLSRHRRRGGIGKRFGPPVKGAASKLMRFYGVFEQRFLIRQRLRTILLAIAAIWVLWTFGIGDAGIARLIHVKHQNSQIEPEIERLVEQEAELRREVNALTNPKDVFTLEKVAREEHALVRDGEVLVRFYEAQDE